MIREVIQSLKRLNNTVVEGNTLHIQLAGCKPVKLKVEECNEPADLQNILGVKLVLHHEGKSASYKFTDYDWRPLKRDNRLLLLATAIQKMLEEVGASKN